MDNSDAKWDAQLRKGTLEMVILAALAPSPRYGLELLNYLHRFETMVITEGTLYPLLERLKREALISAKWQQNEGPRPRKYYAITAAGQTRLLQMAERWRQSVSDIEQLIPAHIITGREQG